MVRVQFEYVSIGDADQFGLACMIAIEAGLEAAEKRGVNVKALMICSPHNPPGVLSVAYQMNFYI